MGILGIGWAVLHAAIVYFLIFPLVTRLIARLRVEPAPPKAKSASDFACLITAYRNVDIAVPLVESLLRQSHPRHHIYLVGDRCDLSALNFDPERVSLLQPESPLDSKVRSMRYALNRAVRQHDYVVIFDPDNLATPNFLAQINQFTQQGYRAVQGERIAKNTDSLYASLDAAGEAYYNHSVRYVPWRLGSSSTISGSGMAVAWEDFQTYLGTDKLDTDRHAVILAEDKILQMELVERGVRIANAPHALLYDEKVVGGQQVERQRTRWIKSYFEHLGRAWGMVGRGVRKADYNRFVFGLFLSLLPMFLMIGGATILGIVDLLGWMISGKGLFSGLMVILFAAVLAFVGNFLWVLHIQRVSPAVWKALGRIPWFMWRQFRALLGLKNTQSDFLVTEHSKAVRLEELE